MTIDLEQRMNQTLKRLGIHDWQAIWDPDHTQTKRGQTLPQTKTIIIYDSKPEEALETLLHEILELRFRRVERVYREAFNALVGAIQSMAYSEKEQFLNDLPYIIRAFEEGRA